MGTAQEHPEVVLIVAACSRHGDALDWAQRVASEAWGPIALSSKVLNFDQTDYYEQSMGSNLLKTFFAFEELIDPARLTAAKHETNDWELSYRQQHDHSEQRPLNLDPGYITEAKLVLASTKDHSHRIYLADGIYAEVTLHYQKKQWQHREWTYPDYRTSEYHQFFTQCRQYLRSRRRM